MTRYNKSKIMKEAHRLVKVEELTLSQALKLAWSKARRDESFLIVEVRVPIRRVRTEEIMKGASAYYASKKSGAYIGD